MSPRSDYGLFYQKDQPVYGDLIKIAKMLANPSMRYGDLHIASRCDKERCNINHTYSIKMHSWTKETFHKIPDNITHWFVANNGITDDPRIESIPFGIGGSKPEDSERFFRLIAGTKKERKNCLYINFGYSTYERLELRNWYKEKNFDWVVIKENIPFEEYIEDLLTYKFVLCPNGNGVDCYRTLECIYAGAIPIVEYNNVTTQFSDLPICFSSNLKFRIENLDQKDFNLQKAKLSYWRDRIQTEKKMLKENC